MCLLYKKGTPKEPSNFRLITLEPVYAKVFRSLIRNRMYSFLAINSYIETNIQKGFWTAISGTIEHTGTLMYMINHARCYQCNLVITLLNLKNAFGELDHNLITSVLHYHHVSDHIPSLIGSFYTNYTISVGTNDFIATPKNFEKGVLLEDSLSPLISNMCFNTLIRNIENEKIKLMGYKYTNALTPHHWFQFANDTALATATKEDRQTLLNVFSKWCQWANFLICISKCKYFGIKKNRKQSSQFKLYLKVNDEIIPAVKLNDSFVYLGKEFSFDMSNKNMKNDLVRLSDYLEKILSLHPKHKINIATKFVYSKLRWDPTIYDLPETWIAENLDNKVNCYIRKWLSIPVSDNVNQLCLNVKNLGIGLQLPSDIYRYNQITVRNILKYSKNQSMREPFEITVMKNIRNGSIVKHSANAKVAKSTLDNEIQNEIITSITNLKYTTFITTTKCCGNYDQKLEFTY